MVGARAEIVEIHDFDDRSCRTQVTTEVRDARAMQNHWGAGVLKGSMMALPHRVICYGDHLQELDDLAPLMDIKLIEEG